jgi:arylsulfatase A-like enzyme
MGKKINVLNVISDQHIARCMGVEGHPQAITPNMDRLAAEGIYFPRAYTQNPICTPSRVSVFSGQYCHNHGYYGLSGPAPEKLPGFLGHFHEHAYRTAGIGKLHTPNDPQDWLLDQCDLYAECYEYGSTHSKPSPYYAYLERLGLLDKEDSTSLPEFSQSGRQVHEGRPSLLPYKHSVEGWCVQEAIKFIDSCGEQPFCMQVSLPKPHQCYTPDKKFWDMYPEDLGLPEAFYQEPDGRPPHFQDTNKLFKTYEGLIEPKNYENVARRVWHAYLACITQVDYALGELLDHLKKTGQAENTIVIYHADHGAYSGTFGIPEKAPGICSDAVCRIPYIWRVPEAAKGLVCDQLVENVDIAPTITSLCGLPAMESVDGKDISELLRGGDKPVREIAVTENPWSKALRWGKWRFVHYQPKMFENCRSEHNQDFGELYNMDEDPLEKNNLYHDPEYERTVNQCRNLLLQWLIDTTRVTTVWPTPNYPEMDYRMAVDGKESNTAGAALRVKQGQINYI